MNVMENICRGFIVNLAICFIVYIYIRTSYQEPKIYMYMSTFQK